MPSSPFEMSRRSRKVRDERGAQGSCGSCLPHRLVQVPVGLQMHPELRGRFEPSRETKGRVRGDAALAEHELVQTIHRHTELSCGLYLSQPERLQKLLSEHFPRVNRRAEPCRITSD